jgi:hypothetical protein
MPTVTVSRTDLSTEEVVTVLRDGLARRQSAIRRPTSERPRG